VKQNKKATPATFLFWLIVSCVPQADKQSKAVMFKPDGTCPHCTIKPPLHTSVRKSGESCKIMPNHLFVNPMNKFAQALAAALDRCIVTNTVAEQGEPVGFLYREAPVFENDSGWRIFSGDETDEYTDNPDNFSIVSLSAITADNPDIAPLLTQAEGSAWELNEDGEFQAVADWQPQE